MAKKLDNETKKTTSSASTAKPKKAEHKTAAKPVKAEVLPKSAPAKQVKRASSRGEKGFGAKFSISVAKGKIFAKECVTRSRKQLREARRFMSAVNTESAKYDPKIEGELLQQIRGPVKFGLIAIFLAITFFILWGSVAPLDKAVVAPGAIIVSGQTKDIQHLEGGIIDEILVAEGDTVEAGQELLKMKDTQAQAMLQKVYYQLVATKALELRLLSEQRYEDNIKLSNEFFDVQDPEIQKIIQTQYDQFRNRQSNLINREEIYDQKIAQYHEQIKGLESQKKSILTQQELVRDETASVKALFEKGLTNKPRLNQLLRTLEDLEGRNGEVSASIASAKEAIAQTKLERINLRSEYEKEVNEMLRDVQTRSNALEREYDSVRDIAERTNVVAPASGIVSDFNYFSKGAVVSPGSIIMKIVPQDGELIIEAKLQPKDIQSVKVGLKAKVQLSAFKTRIVPRISGEVIYVSADKTDSGVQRGQTSPFPEYYIVRIRINDKEIERINQEITLAPGMPASVFIVKGSRTFLQYLLGPFLDSFHRAFKEE